MRDDEKTMLGACSVRGQQSPYAFSHFQSIKRTEQGQVSELLRRMIIMFGDMIPLLIS